MPYSQNCAASRDGPVGYHHHHRPHANRRDRQQFASDQSHPYHNPLLCRDHQDRVSHAAYGGGGGGGGGGPPPLKRRRSDAPGRPGETAADRGRWIGGAGSGSGAASTSASAFNGRRGLRAEPEPAAGDVVAFMSRDEIERCSPSRKDGIDSVLETRLRYSYCSYLQSLGMRLELPQTTIATAVVLCHRFFLRRSHACHDRFLVATAALFLAAKSEETPCLLNTVLRASCEVSQNPEFAFFPYLFHGQDWFEQYRERVTEAEQMILTTLDFELDVKHPYAPLTSVLLKLGLSRTILFNMAWSLVSEGLRSSLWLQFKPHHIAAGAAFLAAKFLNYDLSFFPNFWHEFQTTPSIIQDVVQQLMELF
ncbi:Cyclin-T1-5 [Ananas comosus]|uniref:Cyclin-T1-5 n=1 Tax=Ananas comosus TaxID=4615 RepID=A0A199V6F6_ANACO|nr:Cyclin-T1-5 [Ananas comosus]